jgi:hypothetical protein
MSLTEAQGLFLTNDVLMRRWVEDSPKVTQLAGVFGFEELYGNEERWAITGALATAESVAYGPPPLTDQTTVPEERVYTFGNLGTARVLNWSTQDLQSTQLDQRGEQVEKAARQLQYKFWELFITGDPVNPGEFKGLDLIMADPAFAAQTQDKGGAAVTTFDLDNALKAIRSDDGSVTCVYTSPQGISAINEAFIARGVFAPLTTCSYMNFAGQMATRPCTSVFGVPALWSDFVPFKPDPKFTTDIWFFKLGAEHIHGIIPPLNGASTMLKIRETSLGATEPATRIDITWPVALSVPRPSDVFVIRDALFPT